MPVTRGGRKKDRKAPERRCIATGAVLDKARLIRFVAGPDGQVVPDLANRLPGRGLYVATDRAALEKAVKKRLFARAARRAVSVPDDLPARVESQLRDRLIQLISLARKGGQAVAGFEKVKAELGAGRAALLLQAADGSVAQRAKLRPPGGEGTLVTCLSGRELGLAFGRENVIHAALAAGGLCSRIVEEASRLAGIRHGSAPTGADDSGSEPEQIGVEEE